MTYNVFSGTLNPTHFTSLAHFVIVIQVHLAKWALLILGVFFSVFLLKKQEVYFYFASVKGTEYCDKRVCMSVCLSTRVSQKRHVQISQGVLYMLPVAVAQSCDDIYTFDCG